MCVEYPDFSELYLALMQQHEHGHDDTALSHTWRHNQYESRAPFGQPGDSNCGKCVLACVRGVLELSHVDLDILPFLVEGFDLLFGHQEFGFTFDVVSEHGHLLQSLLHALHFRVLHPVLYLSLSLCFLGRSLLLLELNSPAVLIILLYMLRVKGELILGF